LKHGIGHKENGKLEIKFYEKGESVILSVADNGGDIGTDFLNQNKGSLGVKLIKAFSNRLDAEIKITNGAQSTVSIIMEKSAVRSKGLEQI